MLPRILSRVVDWVKAHLLYSLEFEEPGKALWAFVRTWEKDTFSRVAVAITNRFCSDATHNLSVPGSVVVAVGGSGTIVAVSDGSHLLADNYREYLGSGYSHKLVEYPAFDLRLLKRCLQKGILFRLRIFGSLLDDETFGHAFQGGRASRLDDVTFQSSSYHHYGRTVNDLDS